jgi:integrase
MKTMKLTKRKFRLYKRANGVFYIQNNHTGEQRSLKTTDEEQAKEFLGLENRREESAIVNLEIGKVYLRAADPLAAKRTWQTVMDAMAGNGTESTRLRYDRAMKSTAFDIIRNKPLPETNGEDFFAVLKKGKSSTAHFLRRLFNFALGNDWIYWNIIPPKKWPVASKIPKRGTTIEEHHKILNSEQNAERKAYYEMLWLTGAAQTDCSMFSAENIDWQKRVFSYQRQKTKQWAHLEIGKSLKDLLSRLPKAGFLFPYMASLSASDRSAEFYRRCKLLEIKGISLHSFRYAWAERAYASGYNERHAQAALGHKSRSVHYQYAKAGHVVCPPLENVIMFKAEKPTPEEMKKTG